MVPHADSKKKELDLLSRVRKGEKKERQMGSTWGETLEG